MKNEILEQVKQNFSPEFRRLNPQFAQEVEQEPKQPPERWVQERCEKLLEERGYWRRSQARIQQGQPPTGWYIHLPRAAGNPIVLDLLILHNDGTYIEIELKTPKGKLTKHQKALIDHNEACFVVYGVEEFWKTLNTWEVMKGEKEPCR